jgi:alanine racemase
MVAALDSKSSLARGGSSSLPPGTMQNNSLSYIEISRENLIHNIKQFKSLLKKETKIAAVIKANAYGHGDKEVAEIIDNYVDYFQVDSIEEAERVRSVSKKSILIFGYLNEDGIKRSIKINAIIGAFDFVHLLKINHIAGILKKKVKVHLAIDSYLGREGIMPSQVENIIKELKNLNNILLDGIYSHFANIEDTMNSTHANRQIDTYHKCVEIYRLNGYGKINTHISATSGILVYEKGETSHGVVRLGIGLYGMWPSEHLEYLNKKKIILRPVLKWVTHVAQVKVIPANYPIGYGLTYITKKVTKIAVIPQGYSDGITRSMSNNGEFLIKGKKVKILGRVAMNMTVVDVSNIKDIRADDEVVIIGSQYKAKITAEDVAKRMDTINYEVTTKISSLLPRVIV